MNDVEVFVSPDLLTKSGPVTYAERLVQQVLEGNMDVRQVAALLKFWEEAIKVAKEGIREPMRDEISKHGKSLVYHGIEIKAAETGHRYDYSADPTWCEINNRFMAVKEEKDAWEAMLRKLREGSISTDEETGEVVAVAPRRSSTSSYSVHFPK